MDKNTVKIAIASITHNIECFKKAKQNANKEDKKKFDSEIRRLKRILFKYKHMKEEM